MAALPTSPQVRVDDYLDSSYSPDMEYVDGVLMERSLPTIVHSLLQMILIRCFAEHEKALRFVSLPEVRTQIVDRARYRVPDVVLCPVPLPSGKVVNTIPWAIFEILSPDDRMPEQLERFRDYERIGVAHSPARSRVAARVPVRKRIFAADAVYRSGSAVRAPPVRFRSAIPAPRGDAKRRPLSAGAADHSIITGGPCHCS